MTPTASNGTSSSTVSQTTAGPLVITERTRCPLEDTWSPAMNACRDFSVVSLTRLVLQHNQRIRRELNQHRLANLKTLMSHARVQSTGAQLPIIHPQAILCFRTAVNQIFNPRRELIAGRDFADRPQADLLRPNGEGELVTRDNFPVSRRDVHAQFAVRSFHPRQRIRDIRYTAIEQIAGTEKLRHKPRPRPLV